MTKGSLLENAFRGTLASLFHRPAFFHLHATADASFFEWLIDDAVVGAIHFTPVGDGKWRSPARGTYAGFWSAPAISIDEMLAFYAAVEARLVSLGARSIEILLAPEAHDVPAFATQFYILRSSGYRIEQCDLNYTASLAGAPLSERMSYGNRKRLRKCEREGLIPSLLSIEALGAVYSTIAANREAKGHALSMSLDQIEQMAQAFPKDVTLFGIPVGMELAAAAICLRVRPDVLYVFYWGDRPGYATQSPVVALAAAIADYCRTEGIGLLDAGTSTVGAEPNPGLIQFKRGLGFTESLKLRLVKTLT